MTARVECPMCGRTIGLNVNGIFMNHGDDSITGAPCPAGGMTPEVAQEMLDEVTAYMDAENSQRGES